VGGWRDGGGAWRGALTRGGPVLRWPRRDGARGVEMVGTWGRCPAVSARVKGVRGVETRSARRSGGRGQGLGEEVDGERTVVIGATAEAREVGDAPMLTGGVQGTQTDDEIAQGGQIARGVAGADGGAVLTEGDIAHVMEGVFDAPVSAASALELRAVQALMRAAGEEDFQFLGDAAGFEVVGGAHDQGRLSGVGESGLFGGEGEGVEGAGFMPAVGLGEGEVLREKKRWSERVG